MTPTSPNGLDLFIMAAAAMILITLYIRIFIIEPHQITARQRVDDNNNNKGERYERMHKKDVV
jgi:hypothetical protein